MCGRWQVAIGNRYSALLSSLFTVFHDLQFFGHCFLFFTDILTLRVKLLGIRVGQCCSVVQNELVKGFALGVFWDDPSSQVSPCLPGPRLHCNKQQASAFPPLVDFVRILCQFAHSHFGQNFSQRSCQGARLGPSRKISSAS